MGDSINTYQTCAMAKNQGPRSSRSRVKYTFQVPGFPRSRVKYTFQDPGFPRSHVKYTFQDPGFPRSHVRYTFQDPGSQDPMTSINFRIQSPPKSHNLESPRSHKYTFQDPESQDPMMSRCALQSTVFPRSHELMAYRHNLPPSTYHLKPTTYILKLPHTYNLPPAGWVR